MTTRKTIAAIAFGLCILISGCGDSAEKRAAEVKAAEAKAAAARKAAEERAAAEKRSLADYKAGEGRALRERKANKQRAAADKKAAEWVEKDFTQFTDNEIEASMNVAIKVFDDVLGKD